MTRGGFGQRSDVTVIPAPMLNSGGDFDQPACATRPDLPWDYLEQGATSGVRGQGNPLADPKVQEAVAVCGGCRHLIECGEHALTHNEPVGIWGGLLPSQRKALRDARVTT